MPQINVPPMSDDEINDEVDDTKDYQGAKETFTGLDITRELKSGRLLYYYTCSRCNTRYGPKGVRSAQLDGGAGLFKDEVSKCPQCKKQVCTHKCFDRFKRVCRDCLKDQ